MKGSVFMKNEKTTNRPDESSTSYDDVFRTMITDSSMLAACLVNEMFSEHISLGAKYEKYQNEVFLADNRKRTTDSHVKFEGDKYFYHMECESMAGGAAILIRLFEYDAALALSHHMIEGNTLHVTFPRTGVLYLRATKNTPDVMQMVVEAESSEHPLVVDVPVMKVSSYSLEEVINRKLWFLFPFLIFNYEKGLMSKVAERKIEAEDNALECIKTVMAELDRLCTIGEIDSFTKSMMMAMIHKAVINLVDNKLTKSERIREGADEYMGGQVLEYEAKTILNRGIEQGIEQGREQEREETIKAVKAMILALKKYNGVKLDAVEAVMTEMNYSQEDAEALVSKYW